MQSQMKSLNFDYKPQKIRGMLWLGISYTIIGALSFIIKDNIFFSKSFLIIGFIALLYYYFWKTKGYVFIDEKGININRFWSRHIPWKDFKGMRYYTGSIKLLYKNKSSDIDKDFLSEDDFKRLEEEVKLRLPKS